MSFEQDLQDYIDEYPKQILQDMQKDYMDRSDDEDAEMFLPTRQIAETQLKDIKKTLYKNNILPTKTRCSIQCARGWTSERGIIFFVIVSACILLCLGAAYWLGKWQTELKHGLTRGDCIEGTCQLLNPLICCCNITFIPLGIGRNSTETKTCSSELEACTTRSNRVIPYNNRCWMNPDYEIWMILSPKLWILKTFIYLGLVILAGICIAICLGCTHPASEKLLSHPYATQALMQHNHDMYAYTPFENS